MAKKVVRTNFANLVREKENRMNLNRRLTQKEISEGLGVTQHTVSKWMRGEVEQINLPLLARMMEYFDCSLEDLLIVEDVPQAP